MPRKKAMTLSAIATLIVETFLPDTYQKYLFMNYKQSAQYRSYKSFIPDFLHGRPRSVIIHSLERRSKSLKYTQEDVSTVDDEDTFTVKGSNDKAHTVSFGSKSGNLTPSCTCRDWVEWHIPCKHFLDSSPTGIGKSYLIATRQVLTLALIHGCSRHLLQRFI